MIITKDYEIILKESFGPIKLGMSPKEVEILLENKPKIHHDTHFYFENSLHIEYKHDKVVFIQLCRNEKILPVFRNKNLFDLTVIEILDLFNSIGTIDEDDPEYGYTYIFNDLQIVFWRNSITEVLQNEMNDLDKLSSDYLNEKEFYISEIEMSKYFQTISIFATNYYN